MSDEKITSDDVRKLFGDKIPMEAVEVIWCSSPDKTVAEVRDELEALAKKMAGKRVDLVERLQSEAVNWSATCGDLFGEAATEIASLRERVRVLEGEQNRISDQGYLLGLRAGWNMGVRGETENFNKAVAGYEKQLGVRLNDPPADKKQEA